MAVIICNRSVQPR